MEDNFWNDELVIDFHKKYMGSESDNIFTYLKKYKESKQQSAKHKKQFSILDIHELLFARNMNGTEHDFALTIYKELEQKLNP